jgi:hypothetical protein
MPDKKLLFVWVEDGELYHSYGTADEINKDITEHQKRCGYYAPEVFRRGGLFHMADGDIETIGFRTDSISVITPD